MMQQKMDTIFYKQKKGEKTMMRTTLTSIVKRKDKEIWLDYKEDYKREFNHDPGNDPDCNQIIEPEQSWIIESYTRNNWNRK